MIELLKKIEIKGDELFSIFIPTWNSLAFLQLCIHSIQKNSHFRHQIIVHVNEGDDGTLEWIQNQPVTVTYSKENIGVCWSMNGMRRFVQTDYIVFMNDDMYACPNWDLELMNEINRLPNNYFYLSSTLIQPRPFWCDAVIAPADYGQTIESFEEDRLLSEFATLEHGDWSGGTWPVSIVHRDLWDLVGGYSIEFSPGMYSDPDFSAKLWMAGVRHFKGIDKSRVYHFEARSTGRVKKNNGSRQFLNKWGITSSVFMSLMLRRGEKWNGVLSNPGDGAKFKSEIQRSRLKRWFESFNDLGSGKSLHKE
ncbi:MAG: glycosyltransferase [Bacteroidales bacterium]|nr:glycosyltransferase [Bacteroidales bacterium]